MSYRSVSFVPALFAGVVAGTNLATVTDLRAQVSEAAAAPLVLTATDSCLSAPQAGTPSGGHWYYRIDRATKRQCWYLREENDKADDKFARAAPPASSPASSSAAEPAPPTQRTITSKAIADARAEWVSQQNSPARAEPRTTGAIPAPTVQDGQRSTMPNVLAPAPLSTVRWNDASNTRSLTSPANLQTAAAAAPPVAATPPAEQPPQAENVQQPAAEPVAPAVVEPAAAKPTASLQMLLLVMAAALALAGLTVSAVVRIGRIRARRAMRRKRRAMWDSVRTKRTPAPAPAPPMFHDEDARLRRSGSAGAHHPRAPQERPRAPQERPRAPQERVRVPQEWARAPQERAHVPHERTRVPQERARVPQDRDQVTEMLARLARSAQH